MAGMNKAMLMGRLGKDPEVRKLNNGNKVVSLRLATTETWKDKSSGERKERTEWHSVVIFNEGLCKIAEDYLRKGSEVLVEGQIQTRKYTSQDGVEKYSTEIVLQQYRGELYLIGGKGERNGRDDDGEGGGGRSSGGGSRSSGGGSKPRNDFENDMDDEIPF